MVTATMREMMGEAVAMAIISEDIIGNYLKALQRIFGIAYGTKDGSTRVTRRLVINTAAQ